MHPRVGIIGVGWVGAQIKRWFEENNYRVGADLLLYDIDPKKCAGSIDTAEIVFICVPTPTVRTDPSCEHCDSIAGQCDISFVEDAVSNISGEKIIVIKSTVPPGTTEALQKKYPHHKMLFNPEFLTESRAWEDMVRPDRQIVGFTEKSLDAAYCVLSLLPQAPFMSPWGRGTYEQVRLTATQAELIKYGGNVFFALKVTYANIMADFSEACGVDYEGVKAGLAADYRIGGSHLDVYHGGYRGFGGYCLPKDLAACIAFGTKKFLKGVLFLRSVWEYNENLLLSQELTVAKVSKHTDEVAKTMKAKHGN